MGNTASSSSPSYSSLPPSLSSSWERVPNQEEEEGIAAPLEDTTTTTNHNSSRTNLGPSQQQPRQAVTRTAANSHDNNNKNTKSNNHQSPTTTTTTQFDQDGFTIDDDDDDNNDDDNEDDDRGGGDTLHSETMTNRNNHNDPESATAEVEDDDLPFDPNETAPSSSSSSPLLWHLYGCQFRAVLTQIWWTKLRTPWSSCMEIVTPVLMMVGLVAAFHLSSTLDRPAQTFDAVQIDLSSSSNDWISLSTQLLQWQQQQQQQSLPLSPPRRMSSNPNDGASQDESLSSLPSLSTSSRNQSGVQRKQQRHLYHAQQHQQRQTRTPTRQLPKDDFPTFHANSLFSSTENHAWDDWLQFFLRDDTWEKWILDQLPHFYKITRDSGSNDHRRRFRGLLEDDEDPTPTNEDNDESDDDDGAYGILNQAYDQLKQLLRSPTPAAPTLAEYTQLSRTLQTVLQVNRLPRVFTDSRLGRQWGNLLTLGTVHVIAGSLRNTSTTTGAAATTTFNQQQLQQDPKLLHPAVQALLDYLWEKTPVPIQIVYNNNDSSNSQGPAYHPSDNSTSAWHLLIRVHDTQDQALRYIDATQGTERTWALLDVSQFPTPSSDNNRISTTNHDEMVWKYTIRMNTTTLPNTARITNFVSIGLDTHYQRYYLSGYLTWQRTLNEFAFNYYNQHFLDDHSDDNAKESDSAPPQFCLANDDMDSIWSMPMPTAAYHQNAFFLAVGFLLGLSMVMAYLYPTSRLVKSLVEEKELRIRETLFIMGLEPAIHWWAWFVSAIVVFGMIAILVTTTLSSSLPSFLLGGTGGVLHHSSTLYLALWIGSFSTATIGLCFCLAACFSKAKLAATLAPMVLFATLLPRYMFFGYNEYEAITAKQLASLLPATAFAFGADIVADYEYAEIGVQNWNASEGAYSFQTCINFLILDTFLYLGLAWYLDQVVPREYGAPQPPWFLCLPKFWLRQWRWFWSSSSSSKDGRDRTSIQTNCRRSNPIPLEEQEALVGAELPSSAVPSLGKDNPSTPPSSSASTADMADTDHEPVLDHRLTPCVVARDLYKVYSSNYKRGKVIPAVNHLDLTLYESQITTLLGHNGAGKTTTISLLTGLYQPTSGDATIYGHSITKNVEAARLSIGICPQQNVLFEHLTVEEHIYFFQRLKGIRPTEQEARRMAHEIGLDDFFHVKSSALSGGNKRKLCVAAALCGDPKFLVLDEPTSGMDPGARRRTWEVLRKRRRGRATLLCTHFMDEAEILSDRIAILKAGQLRCSGSALFLKNRFGVGYNLTAVVEPRQIVQNAKQKGSAPQNKQQVLEDSGLDSSVPTCQSTSALDDLEAQNSGEQTINRDGSDRDSIVRRAAQRLLTIAQSHVPQAAVRRVGGKEITIRLPTDSEASFPQLFDELEAQRSSLSVGALGIENASLEEVFIQLADDEFAHDDDNYNDEDNNRNVESEDDFTSEMNEVLRSTRNPANSAGFATQIGLLYWKRVVYQRRDLNGLLFSVVVPVLLVALSLLILTVTPHVVGPPIELSPNLYRTSIIGESTKTDIVVGGGISVKGVDYFERTYQNFRDWSLENYDHINFDQRIEEVSSQMVSKALLESINAHDHYERYGAFALRDRININITVDWSGIYEGAKELYQIWNASHDFDTTVEPIDITSIIANNLEPNVKTITKAGGGLSFLFNATLQDFGGLWNFLKLTGSLKNAGKTNVDNQSTQIDVDSIWLYPIEGVLALSNLSARAGSILLARNKSFNVTLFSNQSIPSENKVYHFNVDTKSSILHNASSPHAVAAYYQHYVEFLFKNCTGRTKSRLIAENNPLPLTTQQSLEVKTVLSILASMFILIPYCLIPGTFVVFMVREKSCKSKHLQLVSGADLTAYWVSSYMYDVSQFLILTALVMLVFLMYGQQAAQVFVGSAEAFVCTAMLTFGYGLSVLPFSYLLARRFDNHSSAQIAVIGLVFITGFVAVNAIYVLSSIEYTEDIAAILRPLFHVFPAYNIGNGLISMSTAFWAREVLFQDTNPLDWDVAGKPLVLLYGLALPYFIILLFVEFAHDGGAGGTLGRMLRQMNDGLERFALRRLFGVEWSSDGALLLDDGLRDDEHGRDLDVLEEEAFVRENSAELKESSPVLFENLWKIYLPSVGLIGALGGSCQRAFVASGDQGRTTSQPKRAVRGMSTVVRRGDIYALLGANGAGKSTTLGMLTGDVTPTRGNIYIAGCDLTGRENLKGVTQARKHIGFCPQVDPLLDLMSVRETLTMFGRLRGLSSTVIDAAVGQLLHKLMLVPHANKTCESLSGGNKRKLSLGIALIGGPEVLLIDESSCGLDPLAKRRMWNLISDASKNKTVVLTTHSMEEAEALCTRAGIMAKGQLVCLGSVQHLKTKYLDGYTIDVFCTSNSSNMDVDHVVEEIQQSVLPGSTLAERHGRFLRFDFSQASAVGLASTFRNLEGLKNKSGSKVDNYSIAQCSLEQVFVQLSNRVNRNENSQDLS
ncbi:hypothetical protein ACA910_015641 [Epithemia clementina (nom. ined.)]